MKSIYSLESLILLRSNDAWVWTAVIKHSLVTILGTFFTDGHIKYKMIQKRTTTKGKFNSFILFEPDVPMFTCMFTHLEIVNVDWMSPLQSLKRTWMC